VIISEHPLKRVKQELVTRGQGVEVVLVISFAVFRSECHG